LLVFWRRVAPLTLFVAAFVAPQVAHVPAACADAPHHAALVIDTGDHVERRCVGFNEDTITGKDVLDRAGVSAVYKEYSYGNAVCSLLGVGNSADDCLGERGGSHWIYYRAVAGAGAFTYSNQGIDDTKIHDGDVQGWKWKSGTPPYSSEADICGSTATTLPPATTVEPGPTGGGEPTPAPGRAPTLSAATTAAVPTVVDPTSTSSTIADEAGSSTTSTTAAGDVALGVKEQKGGSLTALAGVGVLLAGIGIATWRISRRRAAGG
jgi:hypothetical protein